MKKPVLAAFDQGQTPTIACVNKATIPMGVDFAKLVAALQVFADKYFTPVWGTPCRVVPATAIPRGAWAIVFLDNADVANALGYHDLTPDGFPLSKIFVETTLQDGEQVSVTASHELAEMMVDPGVQLGAQGPRGLWYAYETADACEALSFPVNGIPMTDFVFPSWFEGFRKAGSTKFDYLGKVAKPFQILRGGYMPAYSGGRWTQIFGSKAAEKRWNPERKQRLARRQATNAGALNSQLKRSKAKTAE